MKNNTEELINLIDKKTKMVALLAPSFIIDFSYPEIIGMLKNLGFEYVIEVARGATETNNQLKELMNKNPDKKYITSPCPSIVRLIRTKYPNLVPFLTKIDSPMTASAKLSDKEYPGYKKVFIGPCYVKKLEASQDYPELDILVLTFKELKEVLDIKNISPQAGEYSFDVFDTETRLYPISGGLAQCSGLTRELSKDEYDVISGPSLSEKAIQEFLNKPELKLLDILYCDGGCIAGAGIISLDTLDEKRKKVIDHWDV